MRISRSGSGAAPCRDAPQSLLRRCRPAPTRPAATSLGNRPHRVDDFRPAAVVDRQVEPHAGVACCSARPSCRARAAPARECRRGGRCIRTRMLLLHDRGPLLDHVLLEQVHQEIDFRLRPLPVLARQAIQRELLDLQPGTFFGRAADDATPRRCPSMRGKFCRSAQRPLPSMMIAICRGRRSSGISSVGGATSPAIVHHILLTTIV